LSLLRSSLSDMSHVKICREKHYAWKKEFLPNIAGLEGFLRCVVVVL